MQLGLVRPGSGRGHSEGAAYSARRHLVAACQHPGVLPGVELRPEGTISGRLTEEAHQARPASFENRLVQKVVLRGYAMVPQVERPVALW